MRKNDSPKVALITNEDYHHKYWIVELYKHFDVQLIIHPRVKSRNIKAKVFGGYGVLWGVLKVLSIIYHKVSKNSFSSKLKKQKLRLFQDHFNQYNHLDSTSIFYCSTVNDDSVIDRINQKGIDVVCFLGGDIVKKPFFQKTQAMVLNFHSGISPFYNGNKTNFQAMADHRPNFVGGTLMKMNERIDGGKILMHYFVPIDTESDAARLFYEGIKGSVELYKIALEDLSALRTSGISQQRVLKYFKNVDWTIVNDLRLRAFEKSGRVKLYQRPAKVICYSGSDTIADLYSKSLNYILTKKS